MPDANEHTFKPTFVPWLPGMKKCSQTMSKAHFHGKLAMCEIDCAYCLMESLQLGEKGTKARSVSKRRQKKR